MADAYQMFIDGEWVNSSDGQTRDVINPATGEVLATVQEGTKEDADKAVAAAEARVRGRLVRLHAEGPAARAPQVRRRDRGERRRDREARGAERGQAGCCDALGGDPADRRQPPVLRRRGPHDGGPGGGGVHGRVHELRPARADRRRRLDRAVELPADDGDLEDRSRARHREHDRPEALGDDAAHGAQAGRAHRRHPAARCLQRRDRRRSPRRRRDRAAPRRRDRLSHRRHGDGQADRGQLRRDTEARAPGARRQGALHRVRRRRHGAGHRVHQDRRLLQLRPGLHGVCPDPRRLRRLRERPRGAGPGGRVDQGRRPVLGRHRDGLDGLQGAARARRPASCSGPKRPAARS